MTPKRGERACAAAQVRQASRSVFHHFRGGVYAVLLTSAFALVSGRAVYAQADSAELASPRQQALFQDVVDTRAVRPVQDATTFRSRTVAVDMNELPKGGSGVEATVPLNLFADTSFEGVIEKMEARGPTNYTLSGGLLEEPAGSFVLVRHGDVLVAEVYAHTQGLYEVRSVGSGRHVVRQVNVSALDPCGNGPQQSLSRRPGVRSVDLPGAPEHDGPTVIDVMVVYTPAARAAAGGTASMEATVQLFVAAANTTYANSQVDVQLRLVYSGEVQYTESGSANTDLSRLTYANDGYLETVHNLRTQHGADVVNLLVNDFDYCGIAWMHHGPTRAFSVVDFGCGSSTFVHEIGHNMGCAHDRANASSGGQFAYSYGHRFTGQSGSLWRTVMSYTPGQRIQYFSNPNVLYDGMPTGVPANMANSADNAQTVRNTSSTMASYRAAQDLVDCNGNFVADATDLQNGFSEDCNSNDVPDECDVVNGTSDDTDNNDVPDECECDASACDDGVDCTLDMCNPVTGACVYLSGSIPFGDLNFNGTVDVDDMSCALAGFSNPQACPRSDIMPCGGNGVMDVDDLQAVLAAFNGYSFCPSSCP